MIGPTRDGRSNQFRSDTRHPTQSSLHSYRVCANPVQYRDQSQSVFRKLKLKLKIEILLAVALDEASRSGLRFSSSSPLPGGILSR